MLQLFFDRVTLLADRVRLPDGLERTFEELGSIGSIGIQARELTVAGAPAGFNLALAADTLTVQSPAALQRVAISPEVSAPATTVFARQIVGALTVMSKGIKGAKGPKGAKGRPGVIKSDASVKPPIQEVVVEPGAGGAGGRGGPGGPGGGASIFYVTATQTPQASAPGGDGGDGGDGGEGGDLRGRPAGPKGPRGPRGSQGSNGVAKVQIFASAQDLWKHWYSLLEDDDGRDFGWVRQRKEVASWYFRRGTVEDLVQARIRLEELDALPFGSKTEVRALLTRLRENVTFTGVPRDLDVTPDVAFVAQDNDDLYQAAQSALNSAQSIAGTVEVQATFAAVLRNQAQQGENTAVAANDRITEAKQARTVAATGTDVARGRVKNLDDSVKELRDAIQKEQESPGTLAQIGQIVELGVAVGGAAIAVGTGVGAVVAVGAGFVALQKAQETAQSLPEIVKDIKDRLKRSDMSKFKTGLKDLKDAGKSIFHLGELISELDFIKGDHPNPKVRELARLQRERLLLEREVGLNIQMETEAELGEKAAVAELTAINHNVALARGLATQIEQRGRMETDPVLRALLGSVRQLLDVLSNRVFLSLRAREIYLGLDPTETVRYDLGHLHPDREVLLEPRQLVKELAAPVAARVLQIIQWSSLVDEMSTTGNLSRTPVPFWFISDDAAFLAPLRETGKLGFYVPVEDLFEEDGSQIFEVKLDSVHVILHGAKIEQGSAQSIKLSQLGRWSVRRRDGQIKSFALPPREVHMACRQVGTSVEGVQQPPANPRAQPPFSLWGRGVAGDWELADTGGIDMSAVTKIEVGFMSQALSGAGLRTGAAGALRTLQPLPGWPPAKVPPRPGAQPTATWSGWFQIEFGGQFSGDLAICSASSDHLQLFGVGTDGQMWSQYWLDAKGWSNWHPLGGKFSPGTNPAAVSRKPGTVEVFCRGLDNAVWQNYWPHPDTGDWSGWFQIEFGGQFSGDLAICSASPDHLQLFGVGTDGQMWSQYWLDAKGWSNWHPLGGKFNPGTNPAAVSRKPGTVETVEVFCRGLDNAVWQNYWSR